MCMHVSWHKSDQKSEWDITQIEPVKWKKEKLKLFLDF